MPAMLVVDGAMHRRTAERQEVQVRHHLTDGELQELEGHDGTSSPGAAGYVAQHNLVEHAVLCSQATSALAFSPEVPQFVDDTEEATMWDRVVAERFVPRRGDGVVLHNGHPPTRRLRVRRQEEPTLGTDGDGGDGNYSGARTANTRTDRCIEALLELHGPAGELASALKALGQDALAEEVSASDVGVC